MECALSPLQKTLGPCQVVFHPTALKSQGFLSASERQRERQGQTETEREHVCVHMCVSVCVYCQLLELMTFWSVSSQRNDLLIIENRICG